MLVPLSSVCDKASRFCLRRPELAERTALRSAEPLAERVGVDEVRERLFAVELHHGKKRPVPRLELGVSGDVDDVGLEAELGARRSHDLESARTEAAVRSVVDGDASCYGYRPRVVVASATRWTARPYDAIRRLVP